MKSKSGRIVQLYRIFNKAFVQTEYVRADGHWAERPSAKKFISLHLRLKRTIYTALGICALWTGSSSAQLCAPSTAASADDLPLNFKGNVGHVLTTREGRETASVERSSRFDCGDCVLTSNDFALSAAGNRTVPTQWADTVARYFTFKPRPAGPTFLLIERDTVLKQGIEGADSPSPNLQMLSLSDTDTAFTTYACVQADGTTIQGSVVPGKADAKNADTKLEVNAPENGIVDERMTIRDVALRTGGYAGLVSEGGPSLGVFVLRSDILMGERWQPLALHLSLKDGIMRFGYHFPLQVLAVGMHFRQTFLLARVQREAGNGDGFAWLQRQFGLGGSKPAYTVTMEAGSVTEISYPLTLAARENAVVAGFTQTNLPCDLPVRISGLHEKWTTVCAELPLNNLKFPTNPGLLPHRVLGAHDGIGYAAINLNQQALRLFLGHPVVCDRAEAEIRLVTWDSKGLTVELHNPAALPMTTTLRIHKRLGNGSQTVSVPAHTSLNVMLPWR